MRGGEEDGFEWVSGARFEACEACRRLCLDSAEVLRERRELVKRRYWVIGADVGELSWEELAVEWCVAAGSSAGMYAGRWASIASSSGKWRVRVFAAHLAPRRLTVRAFVDTSRYRLVKQVSYALQQCRVSRTLQHAYMSLMQRSKVRVAEIRRKTFAGVLPWM